MSYSKYFFNDFCKNWSQTRKFLSYFSTKSSSHTVHQLFFENIILEKTGHKPRNDLLYT